MAEKTLIANLLEDEETPGALLIVSPVVGYADGAPREGLFLNPFDRIATIKILNQRYVLRLPRNAHGRITKVFIPNRLTPLAYGGVIARIDPNALLESAGGPATGGIEATSEDEGVISVTAPSEGIFYRRPSPEAPPYVEEGSEVAAGGVLGLVEVMKCFNQITYGGPGLPARGKVVRVLADDNSEVKFGQTLFHIRPLH